MATKTLLRAGKPGVQWAFTALWSVGFAVLGRFRRPVESWRSDGRKRVLVLAPHPDDEVCGCGGTAVLHRLRGDQVSVLYVTDGRRSGAYGLGPDEMARRRQGEARASAAALGVHWRWLGLPEGEWHPDELTGELQRLLEDDAPHVVYAPSRVDFHPEHHKVARSLARALETRARDTPRRLEPVIRVYQLQVPLTPVLTNLVAETSGVMAESYAALALHQTQLGAVLPSLRLKRYTARYFGLDGQGEDFWQMSAGDYVGLHLTDPGAGSAGDGFRSFRHYAWSDPLAYVVGFWERRRLARRVSGQPAENREPSAAPAPAPASPPRREAAP